jgi:hypothetical protein
VNVTCNKCGKKYVISDDKVAGKTSVKIRCKQCQNLIAVTVTAGGAPASSPSGAFASSASGAFSSSPSGTFRSSPSSASQALGGAAPSPQPEWAGDRSPPPAPRENNPPVWHAMIAGKQQGPFELAELQRKVAAGEVTLRTYLWKPGMGDWKRASDVPEMNGFFAAGSAGATATGPVQSAQAPSGSSARNAAVQRDVALANETPSVELTRKRSSTVVYGGAEARASIAAAQAAVAADEAEAAAQAAARNGKDLHAAAPSNDLFGDINPASSLQVGRPDEHGAPVSDPFAQLGPLKEGEAPPPGEATKFFIAKAGVNKRNPPWKIALFVLGGLGIPLGLGWVLTTFHIVDLPTVTHTNDDGQEVQESFFSPGGFSGLKDALTGEAKRKHQEAERLRKQRELAVAGAQRPRPGTGSPGPGPDVKDAPDEVVPPPKAQNPDLAALYGDDNSVGNTKLKVRAKDKPGSEVNTSGLSQESAMKVIGDKSKAFEQCVETALHRNPKLAVGNITIVLTVGASGVVKSASVEPRKHESADWAQCMVSAGKRIVFPSSDGDTQLEVPFKVGVAFTP